MIMLGNMMWVNCLLLYMKGGLCTPVRRVFFHVAMVRRISSSSIYLSLFLFLFVFFFLTETL